MHDFKSKKVIKMTNIMSIAIVGYGNIGKGVELAVNHNKELYGDMEIAGIISRRPEDVRAQIKNKYPIAATSDISLWKDLGADVAILCGGSKTDLPEQGPFFASYLPTVDSYDNHNLILNHFKEMDKVARQAGHPVVISSGWDPGTFSLERVLANAFIPGAKAYGFYGLTETGGLSQGHSDAVRRIEGVVDARQYTHAIPESIEGVRKGENPDLSKGEMHWRDVYVVLRNDTPEERASVEEAIKTDPDYFAPYETIVHFVSQEEIEKNHSQMPHDGLVIASGITGNRNQSSIEYKNVWKSNPEATAGILVACARACHKLNQEKKVGAFTMLDIPPAFYSPHSKEELLRKFM